jgi:hypothetical protein
MLIPDQLILLVRHHPLTYEIHRSEILQTKNLIMTTTDKDFAERLVNGYNNYNYSTNIIIDAK